jgi:hypothetical protein
MSTSAQEPASTSRAGTGGEGRRAVAGRPILLSATVKPSPKSLTKNSIPKCFVLCLVIRANSEKVDIIQNVPYKILNKLY